MTLPLNPITPAAFLAAAAAAAQALARPITNAAEAHALAVAETLALDQFDSPTFDLVEALALKEELERIVGELTFARKIYLVRLAFDALLELVGCEATARQAALRAGLWPTLCGDQTVWANHVPLLAEQPCSSLWLGFQGLRWTGRTFKEV